MVYHLGRVVVRRQWGTEAMELSLSLDLVLADISAHFCIGWNQLPVHKSSPSSAVWRGWRGATAISEACPETENQVTAPSPAEKVLDGPDTGS